MNWDKIPERRYLPEFDNLLKVLRREIPDYPVLFEFYFNERLYRRIYGKIVKTEKYSIYRRLIQTFFRLGYDYATVLLPGFKFTDPNRRKTKDTFSLNEDAVIRNRKELDTFAWPDPKNADYALLEYLSKDLPQGMKFIPYSPDGVLENVIRLVGFDQLCLSLYDDPQFVEDVFEQVGSRLVWFYQRLVEHGCVGACIANDDWGFKGGTLISPLDLRRLVFPWYKKIVGIFHSYGKPVILHSCGYFENIIEDIIDDIRFDGRHSYKDNIMSVEQAYESYHESIAIIGGIDVNFMCNSNPEDIYSRSKDMLKRAADRGGFALGAGNSVPEYMQDEKFFALIYASLEFS